MFELGLFLLAVVALVALVGYLKGGQEGAADALAELLAPSKPAAQPGAIATCGDIALYPGRINQLGDFRPLAGVSVAVAQVGEVSARSTATRTLLLKQHGWQKKMDNRELWVTVDGPDFQWATTVPPAAAGTARQFAAAVNTAARQAAVTEPR